MRSHSQIVRDHGATNLVRDLALVGVTVMQSTPQRWADRDSIPGEYWAALAELKVTTLEELAGAAAHKSTNDDSQSGAAA